MTTTASTERGTRSTSGVATIRSITLKQYLIEERLMSETHERAIFERIDGELSKAVAEAEGSEDPDDPTSHVYARVVEPSEPVTTVEPAVEGETPT